MRNKIKLLLAIVIFGTFLVHSSPYCFTTQTVSKKTGTVTVHAVSYAGCNCPCSQNRYSASICSECGHKVVEPGTSPITDTFKVVADRIENLFKRLMKSLK